MLTNPIYAGAYAFGRTGSRITIEEGRKQIVRGFRKERGEWEALIIDRHEGYISWTEFERNQRLIADNANGKSFMSRGSVRRGEALLAGLLRCGHCGRKLHVAYSGTNGSAGRYHCRGGQINHGGEPCISFGGVRVDRAVGAEVIERLQPLGVEAALAAAEMRRIESAEKQRQIEFALEQARFEAARARRQYDTVDPENRLVAGELERRWNERLAAVRALEDECDALAAAPTRSLSLTERGCLLALGADLERAWNARGATSATRKRIVRTLIEEIVVRTKWAAKAPPPLPLSALIRETPSVIGPIPKPGPKDKTIYRREIQRLRSGRSRPTVAMLVKAPVNFAFSTVNESYSAHVCGELIVLVCETGLR